MSRHAIKTREEVVVVGEGAPHLTKRFVSSPPSTMAADAMQTSPVQSNTLSLANILSNEVEPETVNGTTDTGPGAGWDEEEIPETTASEGFCVECEGTSVPYFFSRTIILNCLSCVDQPAEVTCESCKDVYCEVCFAAQHRKGSRKQHKSSPLSNRPEKHIEALAETQSVRLLSKKDASSTI